MSALEILLEPIELKDYYMLAESKNKYEIGQVKLIAQYSCQSFLGKCSEDLDIELYIDRPEDLNVDAEIKELKCEGKLGATAEGHNLHLEVNRGRGEGRVEVTYGLQVVNPEKEGKYEVTLIYYVKFVKTGEKREIPRGVYKLSIEVVKPFQVDIKVTPSQELFEDDRFKVVINVESFIEDSISYEISYGAKSSENIIEVKPYKVYEIVEEFSASIESKAIAVRLESVKLKYVRSFEVKLLVKKPPRIEILAEEIVKNVKVGDSVSLSIKLRNRSLTKSVKILIKSRIYEHNVEKQIDLEPNEERLVNLETPPLSLKSLEVSDAVLEFIEYPGEHVIRRVRELPKPLEPKVFIEIDTKQMQLYSSVKKRLILKFINNEDYDVKFVIERINSSNVNVNVSQTSLVVSKNKTSEIFADVTPTGIGEGKIMMSFTVFKEKTEIASYESVITATIVPSFEISNIAFKGLRDKHILKGQPLTMTITIINYADIPIELYIKGINVTSNLDKIYALPGSNEYTLNVIINKEKPSLTFSDGTFVKKVTLDLEVVKPYVGFELKTKKVYAGLHNAVKISIKNPFNQPINVGFRDIESSQKIQVVAGEKEKLLSSLLTIPPYESGEIDLIIEVLTLGKASIKLNSIVTYKDESNTLEKTFDLTVEEPINVTIRSGAEKILLPYPLPPAVDVSKLYAKAGFTVTIRNISDTTIPVVNISVKPYKDYVNTYISTKCEKEATYHLPPKGGDETISCDVKIPLNYPHDVVELKLIAKIGVMEFEKEIRYSIERENFISIDFERISFTESCPYYHIEREGYVKAYMPISFNASVCGSPTKLSTLLLEVVKDLRDIIEKMKLGISPWKEVYDILYSSIVAKDTTKLSENIDKVVEKINEKTGEVIVVPALIWKYALSKLIFGNVDIKKYENIKPGVIMFTHNNWYSLNNDYYECLLKMLIENDEASMNKLREIVIASNYTALSPILLAYVLAQGNVFIYRNLFKYDSNVSDLLMKNKLYRKYLTYLTLAEPSWIFDEKELEKFKKLLQKLSEKEASFVEPISLIIIYRRILYESLRTLLGV